MARRNLSFIIYVKGKPFCVLYGEEKDAKDFVAGKDACYEPVCTVIVQSGLGDKERDA